MSVDIVDSWKTVCGKYSATVKFNNFIGVHCGYIEIPLNSLEHEQLCSCVITGFEDIPIVVHGGITYSTIDYSKDVLVLGFDCGHYNDRTNFDMSRGVFRDAAYVRIQCELMAMQIARRDLAEW